MSPGITVVICTHNGAARLPQTLTHLRAQQVSAGIAWEVLLVDNASTDDTVAVAHACWPETDAPAPLRIISEPRLGVGYARHHALVEARYDIISQVDDDNWVAPDWIERVSAIFQEHPEVGACGGPSQGVYETSPPVWWDEFAYSYAIGEQAKETGYVTRDRRFLWGAGLSVRRTAWQALLDGGMQFRNVARLGTKKLGAGEDVELCLALVLAGWELWYDTRLQMQHYMTAPRLSWQYLRRLQRGFGAGVGSFYPYWQAIANTFPDAPQGFYPCPWHRQILSTTRHFVTNRANWRALLGLAPEGDPAVLRVEQFLGQLQYLLQERRNYLPRFNEIERAPWRETACPQKVLVP